MSNLRKTVLHSLHIAAGAQMAGFGGWDMPIQYTSGILTEHLSTRKGAGLFDVSHMGRFIVSGENALPFLQHVLTNNAAALEPGQAQYTIVQNRTGGALDDAYLYYFRKDQWLLVVNASNREKDWTHFQEQLAFFPGTRLKDETDSLAMISIQGPDSRRILEGMLSGGYLPEPMRNALSTAELSGIPVRIARTGYTGEPICFELFVPGEKACELWEELSSAGASPVGLGARDTLRLEAGLPLYGHELGSDPEGDDIPIFSIGLAAFAVSFSPLKGEFLGREALALQHSARRGILHRDYSELENLPRRIRPFVLTGKGIAREGARIFHNGKLAGWVTSGTSVPYWKSSGEGIQTVMTEEPGRRSLGLALLDSTILKDEAIGIEIRGKMVQALTVPYHLRSEAPPFCHAAVFPDGNVSDQKEVAQKSDSDSTKESRYSSLVLDLLQKSLENTDWRQKECLNLIPSEMTASGFTRMLTIMDPSFRYGEHKKVKAFRDAEVFYYQGTDFIDRVESLLAEEMAGYLGCSLIESRVISGQMANTAVFSAMVEYRNRGNRKAEPRRLSSVMNNHIIRGGHLSAQPMGALKDFVARDSRTEQPAVVNFPVMVDNPYRIDIDACRSLLEEQRPELIILGKSMIIHREPVAEFRKFINELELDSILMYDMAHVLGLIGPYFQKPFSEGADIVTGSTHKTFFGPQRGVIGANFREEDRDYPLWEGIERRAFPGSVSNHHLGTLLGLLMSTYEMNVFKDDYQRQVIANAKAFALALADCGLKVAGDSSMGYTETHQVIVEVGWSRGAEIARLLEESNIIVNYQATPGEEGFSAAGAIRLGVSEMTRFGMKEEDFRTAAQLLADVIAGGRSVKEEVKKFRTGFLDMKYCFTGKDFELYRDKLCDLI